MLEAFKARINPKVATRRILLMIALTCFAKPALASEEYKEVFHPNTKYLGNIPADCQRDGIEVTDWRIFDGDTFAFICTTESGKKIEVPVRLAGVSALELRGSTGQCHYLAQRSTNKLAKLLSQAKKIVLRSPNGSGKLASAPWYRVAAWVEVDGKDLILKLLIQNATWLDKRAKYRKYQKKVWKQNPGKDPPPQCESR